MRGRRHEEAVTLIRRLVEASTTLHPSPRSRSSSRGEVTTTNGQHGHTNGTANATTTTTLILQEMREFLRREGEGGERNTTTTNTNTNTDDEESDRDRDSDSDSGDEYHRPTTTTFELVIGGGRGEDGEGAPQILRVDVIEDEGTGNTGEAARDHVPCHFFDVDLSSDHYTIGDAGCSQLVYALGTVTAPGHLTTRNRNTNLYLRTLDLEANGLSAVSGGTLATALQTIPLFSRLHHLNLGCNGLGPDGCATLAMQLVHVRHLESLDLHGNGIADPGCVALAASLSRGAVPFLQVLDVSANRIETAGAAALGRVLFPREEEEDENEGARSRTHSKRRYGCCCRLTTLNLRENGIDSIAALFNTDNKSNTTCCALEVLDLSWNSIGSFATLLAKKDRYPQLTDLALQGNALSDADCVRFCAQFASGGALEDSDHDSDNDSDNKDHNYPPVGVEGHEEDDTNEEDCSATSRHLPPQHRRRPLEAGSERRLRVCLRQLADNHATNAALCQLDLWRQSSSTSSSMTNNTVRIPPTTEEEEPAQQQQQRTGTSSRNTGTTTTCISSEERDAFPARLRRDGFVVVEPPLARDMQHLAAIMTHIENAHYPPVFCFMHDTFWEFVTTQVWPRVSSLLLGVDNAEECDCLLDSGSAFAWSLKATGKSTFPRDGEFRSWQNAVASINPTVPKETEEEGYRGFGSSFGLPHRDYSAADSLHCDGEEEEEDDDDEHHPKSPAVLNVWIPLNDATTENGCMYVVPREFDADFARTDGHHAHMNPATEVQRGVSSKIHFPLHGVRALPAKAGSLIAWYGNTIHWGSSCSKYAEDPRKSIALTFIRSDCHALSSSSKTTTTKKDDNVDEARVHNPSPPISITQAAAMTPEMRLSLISRSLLIYNQWHALADDAVPPLIYKTTEVQEKIE